MTYIQSNKLLRIHRTMKQDKKKTYIASDFMGNSNDTRKHLDILINLGLVKQARVIGIFRSRVRIRADLRGYRLT